MGTTKINQIQEYPQVLHNLIRYRGTRRYYRTYISTSYLILVLQSLLWCFGSYPGISEHIHVFRILYMYYRTYTCVSDLTCISDLIHILQIIYLSYGTYTGLTELILVLRNLFLCEGIRKYDESEQIRIISHTRSDQTYTDTDISLS